MPLKMDHHWPISETPLKMAFCWRVNGPPLNGSFVIFRGSGSILLGNLFQGGPDPLPISGSSHGMHLKEGTCLKCSVIIGRKVGLDYNS